MNDVSERKARRGLIRAAVAYTRTLDQLQNYAGDEEDKALVRLAEAEDALANAAINVAKEHGYRA